MDVHQLASISSSSPLHAMHAKCTLLAKEKQKETTKETRNSIVHVAVGSRQHAPHWLVVQVGADLQTHLVSF